MLEILIILTNILNIRNQFINGWVKTEMMLLHSLKEAINKI